MEHKTVVITGGTSGIGEVAADACHNGRSHCLITPDKVRGDATLARLHIHAPNLAHAVYFADLTRLSEMVRVAAQVATNEPPIDVLINNAGALYGARRLTEDGLHSTCAQSYGLFSLDREIA